MLRLFMQTPIWVWGLLVYILYVGIKALRDRDVLLYKLYIIPVLFLVLRWDAFSLSEFITYLVALVAGVSLGYSLTHQRPGEVLVDSKIVCLKGSYTTLLMLLVFFVIKYTFGFWKATQSVMFEQYAYIGAFISVLFPGFFLGRAIYYTQLYLKLNNLAKIKRGKNV